MKKKSAVVTTTAVSLGLATILTISAVAPSYAKSHKTTGSAFSSSSTAAPTASGSSTRVAPATVSVNFTVTNVPAAYTDAATAAKHLLFKVVPLAADATSAPATPPAPAFGAKGPKGAPDNDGDGPGANGGAWTPSTTSTTAPTTGSTSAPTTSSTAAPTFGDNDGDGPGLGDGDGHGRGHGHGRGGFGPEGKFSNLTLSNGTLTGTITVPAGRTAGVQKVGVYPYFAADSANNVAAKSGTPVMLTITTVADATTGALTASVTASTGNVSLSLG